MKLYPPSNVAAYHKADCPTGGHMRPLIKVDDPAGGKKKVEVPDMEWGVECAVCEPDLQILGWGRSLEERPLTWDEKAAAERAEQKAHLTIAQSQNLLAEVLAKLLTGEIKPAATA